jgi:hypothetical protein
MGLVLVSTAKAARLQAFVIYQESADLVLRGSSTSVMGFETELPPQAWAMLSLASPA